MVQEQVQDQDHPSRRILFSFWAGMTQPLQRNFYDMGDTGITNQKRYISDPIDKEYVYVFAHLFPIL